MLLIYRLICGKTGECCLAFRKTWQDGRKTIAASVSIGFAAGVQSALISFSNLFVWSYINRFPTAVSAGVGTAIKLDRFVVLPCKALAMTTTTFVSQNTGARQYRRARRGIWYGLGLSASVTAVLAVLLYTFAETMISLFSPDPEVIRIGANMSRFLAPFYMVMVVREVLLGYMRGYGVSRGPAIVSLIGMIGVRQVFLAWATPKFGTVRVIYAAFPVGWCAAALFLLIYMLFRLKRMWGDIEKPEK